VPVGLSVQLFSAFEDSALQQQQLFLNNDIFYSSLKYIETDIINPLL